MNNVLFQQSTSLTLAVWHKSLNPLNSFTFRLVDQNTATAGHNAWVNVNRLNWCDHCKKSMTVRYDVILWSGMRLKIKVGLNQSRTWSTTTVAVHNQYIKRKKWHQHGVKTGGHSFIRDPLLRKVGVLWPPDHPGSPPLYTPFSRRSIVHGHYVKLWNMTSSYAAREGSSFGHK